MTAWIFPNKMEIGWLEQQLISHELKEVIYLHKAKALNNSSFRVAATFNARAGKKIKSGNKQTSVGK